MNYHMSTNNIATPTERINRLKVVLVEQNRTGKWLAEQLGKKRSNSISLVLQYSSTIT